MGTCSQALNTVYFFNIFVVSARRFGDRRENVTRIRGVRSGQKWGIQIANGCTNASSSLRTVRISLHVFMDAPPGNEGRTFTPVRSIFSKAPELTCDPNISSNDSTNAAPVLGDFLYPILHFPRVAIPAGLIVSWDEREWLDSMGPSSRVSCSPCSGMDSRRGEKRVGG